MTECLEQKKARLFIRYLKERGIYMPFFKNHMACHRGRGAGVNKIAEAFEDLNFNEGIINANCSFCWSDSNEGSKFWYEEDDAIHHYTGYANNKSLYFIEEHLKLIFEDTALIRKKKF